MFRFSTHVTMFRSVTKTYTMLLYFFIVIAAYGFAFYIMLHKDTENEV